MRIQVAKAMALLPGVETPEEWTSWCENPHLTEKEKCETLPKRVPMMTARRMSTGVRYANEVALSLLDNWQPDAVVFTSRHGELSRGEKIMTTLSASEPLSPTDFMVSVHNSAVGMFTIAAHLTVPSSSVASGADSFSAGLLEAETFFANGAKHVLLVDFDSALSPLFAERFPQDMPSVNYAVGYALERGSTSENTVEIALSYDYQSHREPTLPISLAFYAAWLKRVSNFVIEGKHSTLTGSWL